MLFQFHTISWREPLWIFLAFQPVVFLIIRNIVKNKKNSNYADKDLYPWLIIPSASITEKSLINKNFAYLIAWLLFSIALSGPRWPISHQSKDKTLGADIMLVIDHSKSMRARDISPNRLRRAKLEIYELLEKAGDHRIGITVFSGRPHLFVPLTYDHDVIKQYLGTLEQLVFPTDGSSPIQAIQLANKELEKNKKQSAIILLTDGDYSSFTEFQLKDISQSSIPIYVLGIGTVEGDAIQSNDGEWLRHNGKHVISKMNEVNLMNLSSYSKGKYSPVYDDSRDWNSLFDQGIALSTQITNIEDKKIIWKELFPYFLIPSILLFLISLNAFKLKRNNFSIFTIIFVSICLYPTDNIYAFEFEESTEQTAFRSYQTGKFIDAVKLYKDIKGYKGHLGQANSLYRQGHYHKAISHYTTAVMTAQNDNQRVIAIYNLANSYFRTGQFSLAISTYRDVLRYQPTHEPSIYNLKTSEILKKNIELRLKAKNQKITSTRQGRGTQSSYVPESSEIGDNTSVSVSENDTLPEQVIPLPNLPNMDKKEIEKLILSRLKNIKLAKKSNTANNDEVFSDIGFTSTLNIEQYLIKTKENQYLLWKRLFEIEEGFPASVDEPRQVPGIEPW